jgi:hypothetical protein
LGQKATSTKGSLPALERRHANVLQKLTVLDTARPDDDLLRDDQAEQYVEERRNILIMPMCMTVSSNPSIVVAMARNGTRGKNSGTNAITST